MTHKTIAVAIETARGSVVKRVRKSMLAIYLKEGWHVVPRHRFKEAKREHERRTLRT